jgi:hypothetical protein
MSIHHNFGAVISHQHQNFLLSKSTACMRDTKVCSFILSRFSQDSPKILDVVLQAS